MIETLDPSKRKKQDSPMTLDQNSRKAIFGYLGVNEKRISLNFLIELTTGNMNHVSWESVSSILKRYNTDETQDFQRWPEEFWMDAVELDVAGTCYESWLAFFELLRLLGAGGYHRVNDMGENNFCLAAIVGFVDDKKYLVEINVAVLGAVKIQPGQRSILNSQFYDYSLRPGGFNHFQVERPHPSHGIAFNLIDKPVPPSEYRAVVEKDYIETEFFLTSFGMVKVVNTQLWRIIRSNHHFRLEGFHKKERLEIDLQQESLAEALVEKLDIPEKMISQVFDLINR